MVESWRGGVLSDLHSTSGRAGIHDLELCSGRGFAVGPEIEWLLRFAVFFITFPGLQRYANYLGTVFALNDKTSAMKKKMKMFLTVGRSCRDPMHRILKRAQSSHGENREGRLSSLYLHLFFNHRQAKHPSFSASTLERAG